MIARSVSNSVRRTAPSVSTNLRQKRGLISRRAVRDCAPVQIAGGSRLALLEGHLCIAILDANARERLVGDTLRATGGDRVAAIQKVLHDLQEEDKRLS
jgi:hypothetical protein